MREYRVHFRGEMLVYAKSDQQAIQLVRRQLGQLAVKPTIDQVELLPDPDEDGEEAPA